MRYACVPERARRRDPRCPRCFDRAALDAAEVTPSRDREAPVPIAKAGAVLGSLQDGVRVEAMMDARMRVGV